MPRFFRCRKSRPRLSRPTGSSTGPWVAAALLVALAAPRPAPAADLQWHGLLDLVGAELTHDFGDNVLERGDNPYDAYRARLFVQSALNEHVSVLGQFVFDDAVNPYVDGMYVEITPWPSRDLHVLAGKIPWAIGTWGPRTYSDKNPLIAPPLLYQHSSSLAWFDVPADLATLLSRAGAVSGGAGMPIVDDSYWDVGVTLSGSARPLEYAIGVTQGTPGWGSTSKDDNSGKSVLGRMGLLPLPSLRLGVSGAIGPYMAASLDPRMPPGHNVNDYLQELVMADFEFQLAQVELRAEGARNVWQTPTVGDLGVRSGYAELKYLLPAGWYAAGRWDVERFDEVDAGGGATRPWDWNVERLDAGIGYRISRNAIGKVVCQREDLDPGVAGMPHHVRSLWAGQLSLGF